MIDNETSVLRPLMQRENLNSNYLRLLTIENKLKLLGEKPAFFLCPLKL